MLLELHLKKDINWSKQDITNQASTIVVIKISRIGPNFLHSNLISRNSWNLKVRSAIVKG